MKKFLSRTVSTDKKRRFYAYTVCNTFLLFSLLASKLWNRNGSDAVTASFKPSHDTSTNSYDRSATDTLGFTVESPRSSRVKLHIKNSCTQKKFSCILDRVKFSYVYFLAKPTAQVVHEDSVKPELSKLTYFDYTFASVSRLAELTSLHILILVTNEVTQREIFTLQGISEQISIKQVKPLYMTMSIATVKSRHVHTFGKYEVLLPSNTMAFSRLVFMDMDTFSLRNVDELFCSPAGSFGVAKRDNTKDPASFNSGVFVYTPSLSDYNFLWKSVKKDVNRVWFNGEQTLLNKRFSDRIFCLETGYNCLGFLTVNSSKSLKCSIKGDSDSEVWAKRQIVHSKFSDKRFASSIPTIAKKWESYLPKSIETLKYPPTQD